MQSHAKTNIKLSQQLQHKSYSTEGMIGIEKANQLAMKLFTGSYRSFDKTFIGRPYYGYRTHPKGSYIRSFMNKKYRLSYKIENNSLLFVVMLNTK